MSSKRYPSRFESRAGFFASTRDEGLSPRVRLECNLEIPVAPGEELKSLLMKVKEESEKACLKLNIQKAKIMTSGPITS